MRKLTIYTDGSANNLIPLEKRVGGFAAIILEKGKKPKSILGAELKTSSYRAELMAAMSGLFKAWEWAQKEKVKVTIISDSKVVVEAFTKEWILDWERYEFVGRNCGDEWRTLLEITREPNLIIKWEWVKGHAGVEWNEKADKLAKQIRVEKEATL